MSGVEGRLLRLARRSVDVVAAVHGWWLVVGVSVGSCEPRTEHGRRAPAAQGEVIAAGRLHVRRERRQSGKGTIGATAKLLMRLYTAERRAWGRAEPAVEDWSSAEVRILGVEEARLLLRLLSKLLGLCSTVLKLSVSRKGRVRRSANPLLPLVAQGELSQSGNSPRPALRAASCRAAPIAPSSASHRAWGCAQSGIRGS